MPKPHPVARLLFAATLALGLAACGKKEGDAKAASTPAAAPVQVSVIRVARTRVPISLDAVGQAEGSREVEIRARVSGILEKRLYEEGSAVPASTVLFEIDAAPYELAVQQARAALAQERVRRELAEVEAKRLAPLAADKAIPQREVDQALATAKTATAAIAAAEARLKEAELNLSYTKVRAPISGTTGRALRSEGSLVTANTDSSLLTTMTQVDPIWVRFSLAERDFQAIRGTERTARVQMLGDDGRILADNGQLNFTGSTVDNRMGAVQMRAAFPNAQRRWLPGQFVKVRVLTGERQAALVPQSAVLQTEQSRVVMTVGAENKAVARPIQVGGWMGSETIVVGGLEEGEVVIVDNLMRVRPGTVVEVRSDAPKAGGAR